jgi:peptide/nickel transport system substrate-binding protein
VATNCLQEAKMRAFFRKSSRVTGTVAIMAALMVTASMRVEARTPKQALAAPPSGGVVSVRLFTTLDCLDPQRTTTGDVQQLNTDDLVSLDSKGHLQPDLATRWTFSHGGKVITFFLRHGVRFSNGDPLTAGDVQATFDRALDPATKSPVSAGFLGPLKRVKVLNKYKFQLVLSSPSRPLMTNLAAYNYLGILDLKALKQEGAAKFCQYPVGSGPFKIQSVEPGLNAVTLVPNPYHNWEPAWAHNHGVPYLSKVVFKVVVSNSTAVSLLLSGGLDITDVAGDQLARVQGNASFRLHKIPAQGEAFLGFNTSHAPFDTVAVRKAIAEAIDRNALIKTAENGLAIPAYSPLPSTLPFYDKSAKSYAPQYNPADARRILAANHVTGPFTLLTFNFPDEITAAELIQSELGQVGVKVAIVSKPVADYFGLATKGQFDMNIEYWDDVDPDILYLAFNSSQEASGGQNITFYKNETLDSLLEQGRTSLKPAAAAKAYAGVQRFMNQNVIIDPLWTPITVDAVRSRVGGWHTDVAGDILYADMYVRRG